MIGPPQTARVRARAAAMFLSLGAASALGSGPSTLTSPLCQTGEQTVFSCTTKNRKQLAICAKPPHEVQYRFGLRDKVEFVYPPSARDGPRLMRYAYYWRPLTNRYTLSFDNDGYVYSIFDFQEENQVRSAGVSVSKGPDAPEVSLPCRGQPNGSLAPLEGLVACDRDSALNRLTCP
jgi:hypothetical protein